MRAIPISQGLQQFRSYLTSSTIAIGDIVAMNSSGLVVKADKASSDSSNVLGVSLTATTAGSVSPISVQYLGIAQNAAWSFVSGHPVYLNSSGGVVQLTTTFISTDFIVELGTAIGANQLQFGIRRPIANQVVAGEPHAVSSDAVVEYVASVNITGADYT